MIPMHVNEVRIRPKLAQTSFIDNQIVHNVNTLPVAEVDPSVADDEVQMFVEERRLVSVSSVQVGWSGRVASFAKRYMSIVPVLLKHRLQRCPQRLHSLQRGVPFVLNQW